MLFEKGEVNLIVCACVCARARVHVHMRVYMYFVCVMYLSSPECFVAFWWKFVLKRHTKYVINLQVFSARLE